MSRERDALVAEKVMESPKPTSKHQAGHIMEVVWDGEWYCHLVYDDGDVCNWQPRHYSANAWMVVVKKMLDNGYYVDISHDLVAWSVVFTNADTMTRYTGDWKQSLSAQICEAALKAVGYEV